MKKTIFVTGVTRMRHGFVCVSGIDQNGTFVRPEIPYPNRPGIKTDFLFVEGQVVIRPLVKVELEFVKPVPQAAFHTEDWLIDGSVKPRLVEVPTEQEKRRILQKHTDTSLERALCDQARSLVIVKPKDTPEVSVRLYSANIKAYLSFRDQAGDYHRRLPVTDCNWLAAAKYLWLHDREHVVPRLSAALSGKEVFIRIGITREWQGQTWRQVSGVFTIPDWLKGRCFANYGYDFTDAV
ncbi:MAG: hypothetical protein KKG09_02900 [Verrucomicrobia bacterium]|nr:hypothetical protein [Verrucomicrobiota bacterium]MBU4246763.1 hypothetical protein [Verrucomicrobiota bacterium]MBU4291184.1 hypothetical protein [Verrucomicrobiota bacterium]MBU4496942.1 hypothetical protein [Verrucomicrobiota bacterium]MCG2681923.1 hypothetical protein [Kiritimatiellia bacterium]